MGRGWLKTFTADARPGAYLSVERPGRIQGGDPVRVLHRPDHDVTVSLMLRAFTTEKNLRAELLGAGHDLDPETRAEIAAAQTG